MSNVAKFLGLSEDEYILRHGEPLDAALLDFRKEFKRAIIERIAQEPEKLSQEALSLIEQRGGSL